MKVIITSADIEQMLTEKWGVADNVISVDPNVEVAVEIPATMLGLSANADAAPAKKTTAKKPAAKKAPTKTEKKIADELDELAEVEEALDEPKEKEQDVDAFMEDDEDMFDD